jgi:type III secretion system FlhB-like substrate exporter
MAEPIVGSTIGGYSPNRTDLESAFGGENPQIQIGYDEYKRRILTSTDGKGAAYQRFLYVQPNGKDFSRANKDQIVREIKKDFKGNKEGLRTLLYQKGFMAEKDFITKNEAALGESILDAANNHSIEMVENYTVDSRIDLTPFTTWLSSKTTYAQGGPSITQQSITKADAAEMINSFMVGMLDRDATDAEKKDFYNRVRAEQSKAVSKTTTSGGKSVTSGSLLTEEDYSRIASDVLLPAVRGTDLENVAKGNGKIAQQISELKSYATSYGVRLGTQDALDKIMSGMKQGSTLTTGSLDPQKQSIKTMSKAVYTNLAQSIDDGLNIKDISNQYAYYKGQILELPDNSIDPFDPDVQAALRNDGKPGVMSYTDFNKRLKNDPRWAKTKNAREEASSYANEILKSFGLM